MDLPHVLRKLRSRNILFAFWAFHLCSFVGLIHMGVEVGCNNPLFTIRTFLLGSVNMSHVPGKIFGRLKLFATDGALLPPLTFLTRLLIPVLELYHPAILDGGQFLI